MRLIRNNTSTCFHTLCLWLTLSVCSAFAPPFRFDKTRTRDAYPIDTTSSRIMSKRTLFLAPETLSHAAEQSTLLLSSSSLSTIMSSPTTETLSLLDSIDTDAAEALAGPFFGASLLPYLVFLYFLSRPETACPKGVTVGFAALLVFVFLTIPGAIAAKILFGSSLANCDWIHGSAESLLTITNLVTVVAFRQVLAVKERNTDGQLPASATSYAPMTWLTAGLILVAVATAVVPAYSGATVHTPYLGGFLDLSPEASHFMQTTLGAQQEPENALSIATWIIHISSLVEFLVAMGFCWKWADVVDNPKWKGLTWGLLPLHSSGITACTYHLYYNQIPVLVVLQAMLTCFGNTTAAYATYRIARSNGWSPVDQLPGWTHGLFLDVPPMEPTTTESNDDKDAIKQGADASAAPVGFEDLGQALSADTDYSFVLKLFLGCAFASYLIKYGETFFAFPYEASVIGGLAFVGVPSALNAYKWYRRSQDATFEGWF